MTQAQIFFETTQHYTMSHKKTEPTYFCL